MAGPRARRVNDSKTSHPGVTAVDYFSSIATVAAIRSFAQHATASCCRSCLAKWHKVPGGRTLTDNEQAHILEVLERRLNYIVVKLSEKTPARANHHREEAEGEIDGNNAAYLPKVLRRSRPVAGRHRSAETLPRRELEMGVDRHHDDAQHHHRVNKGAGRPKPTEAHEYH
jgi:uncharacterized protein DUF4186